jgi:hypothetical protein
MSETIITVMLNGKPFRKALIVYGGKQCIKVLNDFLPVRQVGMYWYSVATLEMDTNLERRHNN